MFSLYIFLALLLSLSLFLHLSLDIAYEGWSATDFEHWQFPSTQEYQEFAQTYWYNTTFPCQGSHTVTR